MTVEEVDTACFDNGGYSHVESSIHINIYIYHIIMTTELKWYKKVQVHAGNNYFCAPTITTQKQRFNVTVERQNIYIYTLFW